MNAQHCKVYSMISLLVISCLDGITTDSEPSPRAKWSSTGRTDPVWPEGCTFQRYLGIVPSASEYLKLRDISSMDDCETSCRRDRRCGMYSHLIDASLCFLYQHSVEMWERAQLPGPELFQDIVSYNSGTKDCRVITWAEDCNAYVYRDRRYPTSKPITEIYSQSLPEAGCQRLCSMFPDCKSVGYFKLLGETPRFDSRPDYTDEAEPDWNADKPDWNDDKPDWNDDKPDWDDDKPDWGDGDQPVWGEGEGAVRGEGGEPVERVWPGIEGEEGFEETGVETFYCQLHSTILRHGEKQCNRDQPYCGTYERYCPELQCYADLVQQRRRREEGHPRRDEFEYD